MELGKGRGKRTEVYANGELDDGLDGKTWVGQKSIQHAVDVGHDEEYNALYA